MNKPKIYKAHFVAYEGIHFTCGDEWPSGRELDQQEFVKVEDYQRLLGRYEELSFRMDGLENERSN